MNFCIVATQYLPHLGGIESYVYNMSKELLSRGHNVTVLTSKINDYLPYERVDGLEIYRIPSINTIDGRYPIALLSNESRMIWSEMKKKQFDCIVINARFYILSIWAQKFGYKNKIPTITIDHGTGHLSVNNRIFDYIGDIYEHFITSIGKRYCKNYYGVSKASCLWLEHFNIQSKGVLYNAVDTEIIEKNLNNPSKSYRKELDIKDGDLVISFTGRLIPEKGIVQLVESVKKLKADGRNVHLIIAGDGPMREYVSSEACDFIHYTGRIPIEEVVCLLNDSDIFCLPSDSEGFSTSLLEAALCNCFIVTTERGGAKELLSSSEYGIIISDNKREDVYNALKRALDMEGARKSAVELTKKRVKENFTWEKTVDKLENIFNSYNSEKKLL